MLVLLYTLNFVDRQIVGILAVPIKTELGLTDGQLGLMGGLAFALFYSTLGIPIAWLADRANRTWIMTVAVSLWSLATAACGLAQNFSQLFVARMLVGVGEAGGVAPSYSVIADYFPPAQRARAMAAYSLGVPIGSTLGIVFGAVVATYIDWRAAFFFAGLVGLLFAPVFKALVPEPPRGRFDATPLRTIPRRFGEALHLLASNPSAGLLTLGGAIGAGVGYAVIFWLPSIFVRSFGLTLVEASLIFGVLMFFGGITGITLGGKLGDRFGPRNKRAYALIPLAALVLTAPFYVAVLHAPTLGWAVLACIVPVGFSLAWLAPTLTALQGVVPADLRATTSAIYLLVNSLLGIGGGIYGIGRLSDALVPTLATESLRYAFAANAVGCVLGAACFYLASRRLARDWID